MDRSHYINSLRASFKVHPVVALLGARQVGKSTLARQYLQKVKGPIIMGTSSMPLKLENPWGILVKQYDVTWTS